MATRNDLIDKPLSQTEFQELTRAVKDPFFFANYIYLIHQIRGKVKFELYPYQKKVLWYFLTERFNIILKFRQAGITELISMYSLWLAMYHSNKNVVIISIKDRVAKKVLKKIKYMYKNLPPHLQVRVVNGRPGNIGTETEIEFGNGSIISSIPTTEDAARSESLALLVIDEAAIVRWANTIWAAAFPTLSTGGSAILNSCVTGDTEIIGRNGNFKIEQICPKDFGVTDVSFMNLEVLSHNLQWRKVLKAVNKGLLETWEIQDEFGDIIKCTPDHRFLTPFGWKTTREIISKNLNVIKYHSKINQVKNPPITEKPKEEIFVNIPGFPNYLLSNMGYVVYKKNFEIKKTKINNMGYHRVSLHNGKNNKKSFTLARLVVELFDKPIPEGYVVDHINCNPDDNYITNLQIISVSDNAKRAMEFSRGLNLNLNTGAGAPNLELVSYIRYLHNERNYKPDKIREKVLKRFNMSINRAYVSKVVNLKRCKDIKLSRLTVIRKYSDTIYDIMVDKDESYITSSNYVNHNTAYGVGNFFHKMWVDASNGGLFNPIRLYWNMHPERDEFWYNEQLASLGARRTAQEIDGDFLNSGATVFDLMDIKGIEDTLSEYQPIKTRLNGALRIFDLPKKGVRYFIGADVATGRSSDYSAFTIMDEYGEEYGCFKGRLPVNKFAELLVQTGKDFNNAVLAPETNDIGLAVTSKIQDMGYPNLYYHKSMLREKGSKKPKVEEIPGWLTTKKNRSVIIDELEKDIREKDIEIKDPFFVQEAYTFIYDDRNKPVAMGKRNKSDDGELDDSTYTDDAILAKAITNFIRKGYSKNHVVLPK